jgi:hypothetical protein
MPIDLQMYMPRSLRCVFPFTFCPVHVKELELLLQMYLLPDFKVLTIMSQKRRGKVASAENHASGIRGEYEVHGAEEFYQSQGSAYSNPHEDQLKIGVPRCFVLWKDKLPTPFVGHTNLQIHIHSSIVVHVCIGVFAGPCMWQRRNNMHNQFPLSFR